MVSTGIAFGVSGAAMFATSIFSLAPVAYTELFGAQNVPIAIGLSMAVQGVAQVVSAPAVGKSVFYSLDIILSYLLIHF